MSFDEERSGGMNPGTQEGAEGGILPDFAVASQCNVVSGAWDFCQQMKRDFPGTAKAASAEDYLRRTFATLRKDIVNCIMADGPVPGSKGREG